MYEAARLLNQALAQEKDGLARWQLAAGLAAVAGRLEPAEAARACAEAARLLNQALAQEKDGDASTREQLAQGLAAVAGRLEPAEAARLLNQALAQAKDGYDAGMMANRCSGRVGRRSSGGGAAVGARGGRPVAESGVGPGEGWQCPQAVGRGPGGGGRAAGARRGRTSCR